MRHEANKLGSAWQTDGPARIPLALLGALALAIAALSLLGFTPSASAALSFCPPGSGAGECDRPGGAAVNQATGHLYVADEGNHRVNVFAVDGSFIRAFGWGVADGVSPELQSCIAICFKGLAGSGAGQFDRPDQNQIAIDNTGGPHTGSVYVANNFRVQKFDPEGNLLLSFGSQGVGECEFSQIQNAIAVGPGGVVYVADTAPLAGPVGKSRVEKFDPATGSCLGEVVLIPEEDKRLGALAVDSNGDFYVMVNGSDFFGSDRGLRKYDPSGNLLYTLDPGVAMEASMAVDGADHLFAVQVQPRKAHAGQIYRFITEYSPSGAVLRRFGYGAIDRRIEGLAPYHSPAGDLFGTEGGLSNADFGVKYFAVPLPGPIVAPPSVQASPVGNVRATLKAEINPEGKATDYRIDYLDAESFEDQGGFDGPATKSTAGTIAEEDFDLDMAEAIAGCTNPQVEAAEGKCLEPETVYHFRVVATNADNPTGSREGTVVGEPFETKAPLEIDATYATEVGTDTAVLGATVNPLDVPASGYFQYVDDASYQQSGFANASQIPDVARGESEIDFGAAETPTTRSASLHPLAPGTTYHYRLVVTNPLIEPIVGPERSLTTFKAPSAAAPCANDAFRTGASALLPDCRAYELVSPLDKNNGDVVPRNEATTALLGALEQSSLSGDKLAYGSYRAFGDIESAPLNSQYVATRVAGQQWSSHGISPPRGRLNIQATGALDTEFKAFSPDLCQAWIRTVSEPQLDPGAQAGFVNLYRRADQGCGPKSYQALTTGAPQNFEPGEQFQVELQGVSADGEEAIYRANDNLSEEAPPQPPPCVADPSPVTCQQRLYLHSPQGLSFLCVLPNGNAHTSGCTAGTMNFGGSLNRDASLTNAISADGARVFWSAAEQGRGPLYLRQNPAEKQSKIGSDGKCTQAARACTIAVSAQAEAISGASGAQFHAASDDGSKVLFTAGSDLYLFDVEAKQTIPLAHKAVGVMGASEDLESVYLASEEVLSGANPQGQAPVAGKANLYLHRAGSFAFVATLSAADANPTASGALVSALSIVPVRRTSRVSADGAHAAFMSSASLTGYDNTDAVSGKADAEVFLYDAETNGGGGELICASCNPSGARPAGHELRVGLKGGDYWMAAELPRWTNTLYAPRALAEDGSRLFFESSDALVPRDTNGAKDVYQWEAQGSGSCSEADPTFAASASGCIELISSGQSPQAAEFVDASPSGRDVFFATAASLLSHDYGLVDIYDARAGGGLPTPPAPAPECEGDACQSPAPAPNDPTPASAAFRGPGDLAPIERKPRCAKGKGARKAKKANRKTKTKARRSVKARCAKKQKKAKSKKSKRHSRRSQTNGRTQR